MDPKSLIFYLLICIKMSFKCKTTKKLKTYSTSFLISFVKLEVKTSFPHSEIMVAFFPPRGEDPSKPSILYFSAKNEMTSCNKAKWVPLNDLGMKLVSNKIELTCSFFSPFWLKISLKPFWMSSNKLLNSLILSSFSGPFSRTFWANSKNFCSVFGAFITRVSTSSFVHPKSSATSSEVLAAFSMRNFKEAALSLGIIVLL